MPINTRLIARLNFFSKISSLSLVVLGSAAMLGWILHIKLFSLIQSDHPTMKFNTALSIMLSGLTLIAIHRMTSTRWRVMAKIGSLLVLAIGLATLLEYALRRSLGIDELFRNDPTTNGRMTATAALAFVVSGLCLWWLTRQSRSRLLVQVASLLLLLTSALTLLGAVVHTQSGPTPFSNISLPTLFGTTLIGFGIFGYQLDRGRLRILASEGSGGGMMRWLSVGTVAVVMFSVWITQNVLPFGNSGLDHAMLYSVLIIAALSLEWWLVARVNRAEAERNAALADLREQKQLYLDLFEGIDDTITLHDFAGNILAVNEAAVRRLGYTRDELLTMKTVDLDDPDYGALFEDRIVKQATDGNLTDILGTHIAKDGHKIPIHVNSRVITYKGQRAVLAVVRDISALRQAERDTLELSLEHERSQILTRFIRDASHEFRTPLTILATSLELASRITDETKRASYLSRGHEQIAQITKLVSQLALIVELENGRTFNFRPVSVVGLFERLKAQINNKAPARRVQFEIGPSFPSTFTADNHKLQLALFELIDNAVRYSPDDSVVTVRACHHESALVFEVRDTGSGISPQAQKLVFNRFYRTDVAHSTPGFGLGLAIVKLVIEGHHGRVEMESVPNLGSTFRLILNPPASQSADGPAPLFPMAS